MVVISAPGGEAVTRTYPLTRGNNTPPQEAQHGLTSLAEIEPGGGGGQQPWPTITSTSFEILRMQRCECAAGKTIECAHLCSIYPSDLRKSERAAFGPHHHNQPSPTDHQVTTLASNFCSSPVVPVTTNTPRILPCPLPFLSQFQCRARPLVP